MIFASCYPGNDLFIPFIKAGNLKIGTAAPYCTLHLFIQLPLRYFVLLYIIPLENFRLSKHIISCHLNALNLFRSYLIC